MSYLARVFRPEPREEWVGEGPVNWAATAHDVVPRIAPDRRAF